MGLFNDDYEWHATFKKSWWDGSVLTWCGVTVPDGDYKQAWFSGGVDCTACKKAQKKAGT